MSESLGIVVAIDAIIGAGKTELWTRLEKTAILEQQLREVMGDTLGERPVNIHWVAEPSELWEKEGSLDLFYSDPKAHAFFFQIRTFTSRVNAVKAKVPEWVARRERAWDVMVIERSMYGDWFFGELQRRMSTMVPVQHKAYQETWDNWKELIPAMDTIFFVDTPVDEAMRRVRKRARAEELRAGGSQDEMPDTEDGGGVTSDYQRKLDALHREYLVPQNGSNVCELPGGDKVPVVALDGALPYHQDDEALRSVATTMAKAIATSYARKRKR